MSKHVIEKIVHFLKKFNYVSFEYPDRKGKEVIDQAVIYYYDERTPFDSGFFIKGSDTRVALEEIEDDIQSLYLDDEVSIKIRINYEN